MTASFCISLISSLTWHTLYSLQRRTLFDVTTYLAGAVATRHSRGDLDGLALFWRATTGSPVGTGCVYITGEAKNKEKSRVRAAHFPETSAVTTVRQRVKSSTWRGSAVVHARTVRFWHGNNALARL